MPLSVQHTSLLGGLAHLGLREENSQPWTARVDPLHLHVGLAPARRHVVDQLAAWPGRRKHKLRAKSDDPLRIVEMDVELEDLGYESLLGCVFAASCGAGYDNVRVSAAFAHHTTCCGSQGVAHRVVHGVRHARKPRRTRGRRREDRPSGLNLEQARCQLPRYPGILLGRKWAMRVSTGA